MVRDRDDELAHTATAVGSTSASTATADPVGPTLGRYRLERELGAGGMGVVHAAFDPDLERRIALKVLRATTTPGTEAKDRLLREARAMARLAHPNVVTVHEVGTAGGRDFVAMELIHGETLADWLRADRRARGAIIDAFVAAGRGLAAAHAAGIVHRDFKPHNVLRGRDGRIVVTDFGLARAAQADLPSHLETTLPIGPRVSTERADPGSITRSTTTPGSLEGITVTGSLLGTPAYMAPEQWTGGAVTPATDQFAYCVALWEALVGERPYRGPTLDELRAQVAQGPDALDASRLPRRLRATLRRGLDPDPDRRWPSMDALLARLTRGDRRTAIAFAIGGGAIVAAAALVIAARVGADADPPGCEPPRRDLAAVWSPAIAAELRATTSDAHARGFEADVRRWQAARDQACTVAPPARAPQLQCLDGVLDRLDVIRQAFAHVPKTTGEDVVAELIDPEVCRRAEVPRLTIRPGADVIAAYALFARSETVDHPTEAEVLGLLDRPSADPCARVIAAIAFKIVSTDTARKRARLTDAITLADQCGDDRLRADVLIEAAPFEFELPVIGPKGEAAVKRAQVAAARVSQPDLDASVVARASLIARMRGQYAEALRLIDRSIEGYGARDLGRRQLGAAVQRNELRLLRADRGDYQAVRADVVTWRTRANRLGDARLGRLLAIQDALAKLYLGDVAAGHDELIALWQAEDHREPQGGSRAVEGEVVDVHGRPVAGAVVVSAQLLTSDSHAIGVPLYNYDGGYRRATTDASGKFRIVGTSLKGAVQAQHGADRSAPVAIADRVRLVVEPTRRLAGRVDLGSTPHTKVEVGVAPTSHAHAPERYHMVAPVARDGSFVIDGAPTGELQIWVGLKSQVDQHVDFVIVRPSTTAATELRLALTASGRILDVIVRSTGAAPLDGAQTIVLPGTHRISTVDVLAKWQGPGMASGFAAPVVGERVPGSVVDKVRPGDLVAHMTSAPAGDLTVCAIGFQGELFDAATRERMQAHSSELKLKCEHAAGDAKVVLILAPPQQRFE